ncbi:MAG TPA: hypothetical protein VE780_14790 [Thermoleophilaceae bacterium]|jgi:uncharacterized protein (UPF0332 family)|nr:hypothetical protein [Thermoleophilaceae bacterium]
MYGPGGVMTRSFRWLSMARRTWPTPSTRWRAAATAARGRSTAYYAMLYAARAALSEDGRVARKHGGTCHVIRKLLVARGFDEALVARAQEIKGDRLAADHAGATFSHARSEAHVRDARRFVEAIERLIGAEPPRGGAG